VRPDDITGDQGENFAALVVQTQRSRGGSEADLVKMSQQ
jgi:hypothetical protein